MEILSGKEVAEYIYSKCPQMNGEELSIITIGEDFASKKYVASKIKAANRVGLKAVNYTFSVDATYDEVALKIRALNNDKNVVGIMVQQPYPNRFKGIEDLIDAQKDVDGLSQPNMYKTLIGRKPIHYPATPQGIMFMFEYYGISLEGKNVCIVGRSDIVGKPLAAMAMAKNATPIVCHSKTKNIRELTKKADVLLVAVGKPNFIDSNYIKDGVIIGDIGINRNRDGKVCGDVNLKDCEPWCKAGSTVPGGVGLMTVASLIYNCCKRKMKSLLWEI